MPANARLIAFLQVAALQAPGIFDLLPCHFSCLQSFFCLQSAVRAAAAAAGFDVSAMKASSSSPSRTSEQLAAAAHSRWQLVWGAALVTALLMVAALQAGEPARFAGRLLLAPPAAAAATARLIAAEGSITAASSQPLLPLVPEDPPQGQNDSYVALCIAVKGAITVHALPAARC